MTSATRLLELRDVQVLRGGALVLDIPEFFLGENEVVSLIGPNGSGKSSLLLCLMGLLARTRGQLIHRGKEITTAREALEHRRRMAMVLQEPLLFDTTVFANVASGLRLRGLPRKEVKQRVEATLTRLGVAHLAQRSARKLSGGEARRVSLARALAVEPEVIFLDEPFTNLDAPARRSLMDGLERAIAASRIAAILVTHEQAHAFRLADRIVAMDRGRIVQTGAPPAVLANPANEFVASFVGIETILEAVIERRSDAGLVVAAAERKIEVVGAGAPGDHVYCCIRPESVTLHTASPAGTSTARNVFPATITSIAPAGPFLKLKLDCGFPLVAYVTGDSLASLQLEEGKEVFASFKATAVHLVPRRADPPVG